MRTGVFAAVGVLVAGGVFAGQEEIAKWDPAMGVSRAVIDTNGVKWIDGKYLPIEGRPFDDVDHYYDRFTSNLTAKVNRGVHAMRHYTTGMQFRFATDSRRLRFRWVPYLKYLEMDHMPASGVSGIDVYRWDEGRGKWLYVKTGRIQKVEGGTLEIPWTPGERCLVNLPLYNGVESFKLGIDQSATLSPLPPRASGVTKPVVFYGTSITHGGCASRPGMAFPSIIGRDLDVPIVNLGFSGSGRMEYEMSDHLARIDASCYVLDCLPNMQAIKKNTSDYADITDRTDPICIIRARYEPFIRNLRAKRPGVPIVMAEHCSVYCRGKGADDIFIRALYEKLVAEGWKNLVYLPKEGMYANDFEGTVDGAHPNDWGMMHMAAAYGAAVKKALDALTGQEEIAKWDPAMGVSRAVIDTNGVKWIDGKHLPIEGRWNLGATSNYYSRLPDTLTTNVNYGVRGMRQHTSGMLFRFRTDSKFLVIRMKSLNGWHAMPHMTEVGTSGWDVYRFDTAAKTWRFVASSHRHRDVSDRPGWRAKRIDWRPGDACIINLPLYNGVAGFELGIASDAKVEALGPRASGIEKPVVFYGTSITHGGCSSRPGLGWVNIIGRDLDVPVFGLGFSGSGVMEYELSDVIARIDASCYVLDCLWNMSMSEPDSRGRFNRSVPKNYEPFIRNLRAKRPGVPIVMAEHCSVFGNAKDDRDAFIRKLYEKLIAEGWTDLIYLPNDEMYTGDYEGTVDGVHPNDLGMMSVAKAFGKTVRKALQLK